MPQQHHAAFPALVQGLLDQPARISPMYFYDTRGSTLFEEITRLPEYYPTRTERSVMQRAGGEIAAAIGTGRTLIELGAGSCEKARLLCRLIEPARFVGVDIATDFLELAVAGLRAEFPGMEAIAVAGDLHDTVTLPEDLPRNHRLVFYPGSSIGNFDPEEALALLQRVRGLIGDDGALLIGVDLVKDSEVLQQAYDDASGITAEFNRNILVHLNRLIETDFDPLQWGHVALYDPALARIEMHLQALSDQWVRWPGGGRHFRAGERIHTENSYKHTPAGFTALLARAGFHACQVWTDPLDWFAVVLAQP